MPQLDGLRAVAVTFVLVFHFVPGVAAYAPLAAIGVRLFFVLSGFLITGILLSWRGRPLGAALQTFYLRRGLRIFPLFYFALAVAAIMNIGPVRETIFWHASYLSNFYLVRRGDWHGSVSHLWSLAVEEQFYLVWPWLILCAPLRWLSPAIVVMIAIAPVSRLVSPDPMNAVLPTSCLDALGLGALLALQRSGDRDRPAPLEGGPCMLIGTAMVVLTLSLRYASLGGNYTAVGLDLGVSLLSVAIIARAADGFPGIAGAFLSSRPAIAVGKVSYGLYVYHAFMAYVLGRYVPGLTTMTWPLRFLLLSAATGVVAAVSWHLLEKPFLRLKPVSPLVPLAR